MRCVRSLHGKGLVAVTAVLYFESASRVSAASGLFGGRGNGSRAERPSARDCSVAGDCASDAALAFRGGASSWSSSGESGPYGLPLNVWKGVFQAALTALNVACWYGPLRHGDFSRNEFGLSVANAFSGGVFLGLAFGHLLPECAKGFDHGGFEGGRGETLPFTIALGGYLLMVLVEKVAFDAHAVLEPTTTNDDAQEPSKTATGRGALLLLAALSVHSVLEMTALGLADTFADTALLSLSIALHQPAESVALLVAFLKSGLPERSVVKHLTVFSLMGPIGVALGMAVNEFAAPVVDSVMLAVVAGTFVYVGATEIVPEEWENGEHRWTKFGALLAGVTSVLLVTDYTRALEHRGAA